MIHPARVDDRTFLSSLQRLWHSGYRHAVETLLAEGASLTGWRPRAQNVELCPVPGVFRHFTLSFLVQDASFNRPLQWLIGDGRCEARAETGG